MWVKFHRDTLAASSDHMKECLTLSEVHTAINQYKNKKPLGRAGVTNEMLTHVGNSAIMKTPEKTPQLVIPFTATYVC